jgi:hypothetical protein
MSIACPECGSRYLRPSRARNVSEQMGTLRLVSPFRCLHCKIRFFAPSIVWADLFYAKCPNCHRMDLNGWTGKTYTNPPFRIALKVALGAGKLRCEYCRLNFASFRRRKEAFTFKRWKRFGKQAEEHSARTKCTGPAAQAHGESDKSFKAGARKN